MPRRITAFGPACIGNVAAGFDVLGAAIAPLEGEPWGDSVSVEPADVLSLTIGGPFAAHLSGAPQANLVWRAWECLRRRCPDLPAAAFHLHKGLPVGSGLGSSSASVVATLRAMEGLLGRPLPTEILLGAAGEAETFASGAHHLDNVGPALLGGLRLITVGNETRRLPFPPELCFVVASPALRLATRQARAALPATVPLGQAVEYSQNLATLVLALEREDRELLRRSLRDLMVEPARAPLVRGFAGVQEAALKAGAWGASFSGAGPAVFAVAERSAAAEIGSAMQAAWAEAGIAATVRACGLDTVGARRVTEPCS
jgi:homoserine kinase